MLASIQIIQSQSKGHVTNIYLTDSDEEAIMDFVKDREELYDKTMKDCLCERFSSSSNLLVNVCKTWFESKRIR